VKAKRSRFAHAVECPYYIFRRHAHHRQIAENAHADCLRRRSPDRLVVRRQPHPISYDMKIDVRPRLSQRSEGSMLGTHMRTRWRQMFAHAIACSGELTTAQLLRCGNTLRSPAERIGPVMKIGARQSAVRPARWATRSTSGEVPAGSSSDGERVLRTLSGWRTHGCLPDIAMPWVNDAGPSSWVAAQALPSRVQALHARQTASGW